jgi:hypothetical protein
VPADSPRDGDVEHLLDDLYATAPGDFITTRDRMVRELRTAGRREDAAAVAAQRRPTVGAAAMNAIARAHPDAIKRFLAFGPRLREAQLASVRDDAAREQVRELQRERRDAASRLAGEAPEHRDEVERALDAALVDDEVADRLVAGRLQQVPDAPAGFGGLEAAIAAMPSRERESSSRPKRTARDDARLERVRDEEQAARADAESASAAVDRLRRELRDAERRQQEASRRLERAETALRKELDKGRGS